MPRTNTLSNFYIGSRANFNAVLDVTKSDEGAAIGGGAQVLNGNINTVFQDNSLINATVYLCFIDGIQFREVEEFSDPVKKEIIFDNTTGTVTSSITNTDADISIFYTSPLTVGTPGAEPVTLQEIKDYCKIDTGTIDDAILNELITTAREQCEDFTGLSIVARTVKATLNNSCGGIFLPFCPFISIISVKDCEGNVLTTDQYNLSGDLFPRLVSPVSNNVVVEYTAGYGIPPSKIKTAIKQQVFFLYENRGEGIIITRSGIVANLTLSPQANSTLQRLRRV